MAPALESAEAIQLIRYVHLTRRRGTFGKRSQGTTTDAQALEDAGRLIGAWNERQAKRMPMPFSPRSPPRPLPGLGSCGSVSELAAPSMLSTCARSTVVPKPR